MDLHLLLLEPETPSGAGIDPVEFDNLKQAMLSRYDEAKAAKRAVKAEKRSWEYKKAYDKRSENELTALESRVADLQAKRSEELSKAVAGVKGVADEADNDFAEIKSEFDGAKATLEAYERAGKLSKAQEAFLKQINQFFEVVATEHDSEYSELVIDTENSATADKFTDSAKLATSYAEGLMGDYYYGISEYQNEYAAIHTEGFQISEAQKDAEAGHKEKIASIEAQMDAAKAADNKELVEKLAKEMLALEEAFKSDLFQYDKQRDAIAAADAGLSRKFEALMDDMTKKAAYVAEAIDKGEVFGLTGEVFSEEVIYAFAKSNFGSEAIKAAYAELDAIKAEYAKWDAMSKDQMAMLLDEVNAGISMIGKVNRDLSATKELADAEFVAKAVADFESKIESISSHIDEVQVEIESMHVAIKETSMKVEKNKVDLAGLDPASPTYAEDKANLEKSIAAGEAEIAALKEKVSRSENERDAATADKEKVMTEKDAFEHDAAAAAENLPVLEAEYAKAKDDVLAKQLEYTDFINSVELDRKAKIEEIAAAEDAVDAVDSFAIDVRFDGTGVGPIKLSAKFDSGEPVS